MTCRYRTRAASNMDILMSFFSKACVLEYLHNHEMWSEALWGQFEEKYGWKIRKKKKNPCAAGDFVITKLTCTPAVSAVMSNNFYW